MSSFIKQVCMSCMKLNSSVLSLTNLIRKLAAYRQLIHWTYNRLGRGIFLHVLWLLCIMSFQIQIVHTLVLS